MFIKRDDLLIHSAHAHGPDYLVFFSAAEADWPFLALIMTRAIMEVIPLTATARRRRGMATAQ